MKKALGSTYAKWLEKGLEGLIPFYGRDGRNGTLIVLKNCSPIEEQRRLDAVLRGLANLYQKDLALIKRKAQDITGQRTMNPLPFFPIGIFVPFRMRKPVGRNDGAVGYFFYHSIETIELKDGQVQVVLKDGQKFFVMDSIATAKKRIRCACQMRDHLNSCEIETRESYGLCMEWGNFYNQPATRADIALVLRDLKALTYYVTSQIEKNIKI